MSSSSSVLYAEQDRDSFRPRRRYDDVYEDDAYDSTALSSPYADFPEVYEDQEVNEQQQQQQVSPFVPDLLATTSKTPLQRPRATTPERPKVAVSCNSSNNSSTGGSFLWWLLGLAAVAALLYALWNMYQKQVDIKQAQYDERLMQLMREQRTLAAVQAQQQRQIADATAAAGRAPRPQPPAPAPTPAPPLPQPVRPDTERGGRSTPCVVLSPQMRSAPHSSVLPFQYRTDPSVSSPHRAVHASAT